MSPHLRAWSPTDAEALSEIYARADSELLSNLPDDRTRPGATAWLERILTAEAEGSTRAFAIVDTGDRDEAAGAGSASSVGDTADAETGTRILGNVMASGIERRHSTAWVSYWLSSQARGRGLASSALRTLVDVLHDDLGVYRLELGYRVNNPASAAVAVAAGFLVEGSERERLLYDWIRYDTEVCARLAGDPRSPGRRLVERQSPGRVSTRGSAARPVST